MGNRPNVEKFSDLLDYLENQSKEDFKKEFACDSILKSEYPQGRRGDYLTYFLSATSDSRLRFYFTWEFSRKILRENEHISKQIDPMMLSRLKKNYYQIGPGFYNDGKNGSGDIFLEYAETKFNIFIVRFSGRLSSSYLEQQRKEISEEYPDYKNLYVYLSPNGKVPITISEEENTHWGLLSYKIILEILDDMRTLSFIEKKSKLLLQEYENCLRKELSEEQEMSMLSREIYFRHQETLDIIFKFLPNKKNEIWNAIFNQFEDLSESHPFKNEMNINYFLAGSDDSICFKTGTMSGFLEETSQERLDREIHEGVYQYEFIFTDVSVECRLILPDLQSVGYNSLFSASQLEKITMLTNRKGAFLFKPYESLWGNNIRDLSYSFVFDCLKEIQGFEKEIIKNWGLWKQGFSVLQTLKANNVLVYEIKQEHLSTRFKKKNIMDYMSKASLDSKFKNERKSYKQQSVLGNDEDWKSFGYISELVTESLRSIEENYAKNWKKESIYYRSFRRNQKLKFNDLDEKWEFLVEEAINLEEGKIMLLEVASSFRRTAIASFLKKIGRKIPKTVSVHSFEMPVDSLINHMLCEQTIDVERLVNGLLYDDEWQQILVSAGELSNMNILIEDARGSDFSDISLALRKLKDEYESLDLVVIDCLNLIHRNDEKNIFEVLENLRELAQELSVALVISMQPI